MNRDKMSEDIKWDAPAEICQIDENPAPQNGQYGFLRMRDGKMLRNGVFMPEGAARGTIVLMTGYSEFIEKYFETIQDLLNMGYCVAALEWRCHGLSQSNSSDPDRLHLDDFDQNIEDLEDRYDRLVRGYCPAPYFGFAHSMGGLISLRAAHKHPDWFVGLAQSAPMLGIKLPFIFEVLRRVLTPLFMLTGPSDRYGPLDPPNLATGEARVNNITHDEVRFARGEKIWRTHPQLKIIGRSLGWSSSTFKIMEQTQQPSYLRHVTTPLFIGTAEDELLVDNGAHAHALNHLPNGQGKFYPNAKHELVMEKDATREAFLADIDSFYQAALAAQGA
jgi:lysophospholipase